MAPHTMALASIALALALHAGGAAAQPLAREAPDEAGETGEAGGSEPVIVVTGSRIARDSNHDAPAPVARVTGDEIRRRGMIDATEALRQLPALVNSGTMIDSLPMQGGAGGVGQATLNLRGLGSSRTLVLVNGQRHVAGVTDSQIVDVSIFAPALIDRVEVLTGGASSIYGADAVSGVVNFVLRDDFEGLEISTQAGLSQAADGFAGSVDLAYGKNLPDGRGNITLAAGYARSEQVLQGDRAFFANNGSFNTALVYANPDLRFQRGDIGAATPNFANFFNLGRGLLPFGFSIPLPGTGLHNAIFSGGATPTAAEQALIERAMRAPALAFRSDPRFAASSDAGLIFRRDFAFFDADINSNGANDCLESFIGLGGGGCYVSTEGGGVKIFEDGIIASETNQFGGDGAPERLSGATLTPQIERFHVNLLGHYDLFEAVEMFWDARYVRTQTSDQNPYNTFYDTLLIRADNPFIPAVLQNDANQAGGLRISRDFTDLGLGRNLASRDTYRLVGGLRGAFDERANIKWEIIANYGRTQSLLRDQNTVLPDRLFAAIDAVDEGRLRTGTPNGNIVCRSSLDPAARHPGSQTFPMIQGGFFTFNPGDGSCVPITLFNGANSVSPAGVNFITTTTTNRDAIEQFVIGGTIVGDTATFLSLPGGPIGFAIGGEHRNESSAFRFDPLWLGIAPISTPDIQAGQFVGDVSANQQLIWDGQARLFNTQGSFHVQELFGEVHLPILAGVPFFDALEVTAAARYSDYSTVGSTFTWNVGGVWAPIPDIRFRGSYAVAVRAPNIAELFSPQQGTVFRPADPCDANQIDVLDPEAAALRQANCIAGFQAIAGNADLVGLVFSPAGDYIYQDPLTARFSGTIGGNPNLLEETGTTFTMGTVIAPRFARGLVLSVDYYNITIENAIAAVSPQDIVNTCYDQITFPNNFCAQFRRNTDPTSPNFLGFNFLAQSMLNFGRIETAGIDAHIGYDFSLGDFDFSARSGINWVDHINRFFDPSDLTRNNPGLGEERRPEWAGVGNLTMNYGPLSLGYRLQYLAGMTLAGIDIETALQQVGAAGFAPATFVHDLSGSYQINDQFTTFFGINNLTNTQPFPTNFAFPVSPVGRFFFLGVTMRAPSFSL